jgi:hypothetical protein
MIDARTSKSEKRLIAEDLHTLYNEALKSAFPKRTDLKQQKSSECKRCGDWFFGNRALCDKCRKPSVTKTCSFTDLNKPDRRAFITAAGICIELDADAREYIVAQFAMMRAAGAYIGRILIPSPYQLSTPAARVRYIKHAASEDERHARVAASVDEDQDESRRWYVEERKLRGFSRMQRRDPIEVMTEQPEQFSRDFLKHKGVWDVVRDIWDERQRA